MKGRPPWKGLRSGKGWLTLLLWVAVVSGPTAATGADIFSQNEKEYADCIVRFAPLSPSPQAAAILQRACFYRYRFGRYNIDPDAVSAEQRKLSKVYTADVCDCVFEKIPQTNPNIPAPAILKYCIENSHRNPEPIGP